MELFVGVTVTVEVIVALMGSIAPPSWAMVHGAGMTVIVAVTIVNLTGLVGIVLSLPIRRFNEKLN